VLPVVLIFDHGVSTISQLPGHQIRSTLISSRRKEVQLDFLSDFS